MKETFKIELRDARFFSKIGVFDQERNVGNEFTVHVIVWFDATTFLDEDLDSSLSYADIYEIVKKEMSKEAMLLETVSKRIADNLRFSFAKLSKISVNIEKISPPISGLCGKCAVEYTIEL